MSTILLSHPERPLFIFNFFSLLDAAHFSKSQLMLHFYTVSGVSDTMRLILKQWNISGSPERCDVSAGFVWIQQPVHGAKNLEMCLFIYLFPRERMCKVELKKKHVSTPHGSLFFSHTCHLNCYRFETKKLRKNTRPQFLHLSPQEFYKSNHLPSGVICHLLCQLPQTCIKMNLSGLQMISSS